MNNQFTGWLGEQATAWGLSQGLDPTDYRQITDVIIPNGKGGTTQLDHVIISQFGIFVVETKNRNGVIFGKPDDSRWQQINARRIYEFQNPLTQNEGHIQALVQLMRLPRWAFHSIIFFCGEARFQSPMPFNVRTEGVTTVVRSKNKILLWPDEMNHVWGLGPTLRVEAKRKPVAGTPCGLCPVASKPRAAEQPSYPRK